MPKLFPPERMHLVEWTGQIRNGEWEIYEAVLDAATAASIPFALGGSFALAVYTGSLRDTKDLDLYVLPRHRKRMLSVITRLGLTDYFDQKPYDRQWIYRATTDGVIVDVMWAMANHRAKVDEWWLSGPQVQIRGRTVHALPPEAIFWDKLYIMQRERCDWPDVMNLLHAKGAELDWMEILTRLGEDMPLLSGALSIFRWLSPEAAGRLPEWLWDRVSLPAPDRRESPEVNRRRAALLDTRQWFAVEPVARRTA